MNLDNLARESLGNPKVPEFSISDFNESHMLQIKDLLFDVQAAGMFRFKDTSIALSVMREKLANLWDYDIKVAGFKGLILGFIAYGKADLSDNFYDLYWMAVRPSYQGKGVGKALLNNMENHIKSCDGKAVLLETSSKECYNSAKRLYEKSGYKNIAQIDDFYSKGEHKLIYRKDLKKAL